MYPVSTSASHNCLILLASLRGSSDLAKCVFHLVKVFLSCTAFGMVCDSIPTASMYSHCSPSLSLSRRAISCWLGACCWTEGQSPDGWEPAAGPDAGGWKPACWLPCNITGGPNKASVTPCNRGRARNQTMRLPHTVKTQKNRRNHLAEPKRQRV